MSESHVFDEPDHFTAGAIGPKGRRVFYLQAAEGARRAAFKLEKQQVDALATYLAQMLEDLPQTGGSVAPAAAIVEPVEAAWTVGAIGVAYDESQDRIVVVAQRVVDPDQEQTTEDSEVTVRFSLTTGQARAFVLRANDVVAAGRPPCPFCGTPLDPATGLCPCYN